jgi:hypothetical protein
MQAGEPFPTGPVTGSRVTGARVTGGPATASSAGQQVGYPAYDGGVSGVRGPAEITGRFSRDGSSGFPVEPGRYQLYSAG